MRMAQKERWKDIQSKVKNMEGKRPKSEHCVKNAVQRVQASGKKGFANTSYKNCGCKRKLTPGEEKLVVDYVKKWRRKLFCTCLHIKREAGCEQVDDSSNLEQAWVLLEAGSSQEPTHRRATPKEESICREASLPQAFLVGREHALGV